MIYHLSPTIQRKIWGGKNLGLIKNIAAERDLDPIGETWEISIHPDGPSFFCGEKIEIDETNEELDYLVKLIDTSEELSIQVHPGDRYARKYENSSGKSECWLILKSDPEAGIYLGLKPGVTKEIFSEAIKNRKRINELLNFYPVRAGDFFYVPAGSIHAIGGGITLAEVQQNSGITYRVWDWDRVDSKGVPRELHVKKSLDVINFDDQANTAAYFQRMQNLFDKNGQNELITHPSFKMSLVNLEKNQEISLNGQTGKRLTSLLNLDGVISVNDERVESYRAVLFRQEKILSIKALEKSSFVIIS